MSSSKLQIWSILACLATPCMGAEASKPSTEYEYPELLVAPSASERLAQEAKAESKNQWTNHWAIQSSAGLTLVAGILASSDPGKKSSSADSDATSPTKSASQAAMVVGGGWLLATGVLSATYSPYKTGMASLSGLPRGNKREQLAFERAAEESLYRPSRIATVMKWASMFTNVAVGGYIVSSAGNDMTKVAGGLSVFGGFLPVLFEHPWSSSYNFHEDYKKRIYGPLTFQKVSVVPHDSALALAWTSGIAF